MPLPKAKILLLDDENSNLEALERELRLDYEVRKHLSAHEALEALKKEDFAVVISDQNMKEMNGVEFLALANNFKPHTIRVLLTGHSDVQQAIDAINKAEIFRYLTKPWDKNELLATLAQAVKFHQLKKQNLTLLRRLSDQNKSLEGKEQELKSLNRDLELLVEQRTAELQVANSKLEKLAMTDPLTKILNRRAIFDKFFEEIERSSRYKHPISIAMSDIDHFKEFNDMEGHPFGDEALKTVARILNSNIRRTDFLGRYGGEELLLVMPETPVEVAREICERLRMSIEQNSFQGKKGAAFLTISMGVAGYPQDGDTREKLVERADKALYDAKSGGRNRIQVSSPDETFFVS